MQVLNPAPVRALARLPALAADAPKADLAAGHRVVPAAAASFSAARRSASSARKRLTPSLIATSVCCRALWPSAARSCPAGLPAFAPPTSAALPAPSSRLGISRCCRLQQDTRTNFSVGCGRSHPEDKSAHGAGALE